MESTNIKGLVHITGGGLAENIPRILAHDVHAEIDTQSWHQGPVFDWIQASGRIETHEMRRVFNCGVGMIVVVDRNDEAATLSTLNAAGETAWRLGQVVKGPGPVSFV